MRSARIGSPQMSLWSAWVVVMVLALVGCGGDHKGAGEPCTPTGAGVEECDTVCVIGYGAHESPICGGNYCFGPNDCPPDQRCLWLTCLSEKVCFVAAEKLGYGGVCVLPLQ